MCVQNKPFIAHKKLYYAHNRLRNTCRHIKSITAEKEDNFIHMKLLKEYSGRLDAHYLVLFIKHITNY